MTASVALVLSFPAGSSGFGPLPMSLKGIPIPEVPGLLDGPDPIVIDKDKAIVLGKALFWDTNVGSDGMACGSCHFHAGADARVVNQLSPGGKSTPAGAQLFNPAPDGSPRGPNHTLTLADFPFHQLADPFNRLSTVLYSNDDMVSSAGTFGGAFASVEEYDFGDSNDRCERAADPVFHVGAVGTRRVEPRNAPTVINAVFNHRNFWDGRANNVFSGSSPWGDRDPDAGVWVKQPDGSLTKQRLHLINASLASLALAPPLSSVEMGCQGRRFEDLARKLLFRQVLGNQKVHWNDSVLGPYSLSTPGDLQSGLNAFYISLIVQSFNPKYWSYWSSSNLFGSPPATGPYPPRPYSHMEANFGLFFALALQLYQSTLISDDSPFDRSARDAEGLPSDLSEAELSGLKEFRFAHCTTCHIGATLTTASIATNAELVTTHPEAFGNAEMTISTSNTVVTRLLINGLLPSGGTSLNDVGFASNGIASDASDIGLGGVDAFGNPLSFSDQYLQLLAANPAAVHDTDVMNIRPCDLQIPLAMDRSVAHPRIFTQLDGNGVQPQTQDTAGCFSSGGAFVPDPAAVAAELADPLSMKTLAALDGSFKVPGLRNVELTGPYMHNGGLATLEDLVEFYTRGGNFENPSKNFSFVFTQPELIVSAQKRADIVAFLKTLTDDRVRYEKAPFDHPELTIPHGHIGDHMSVVDGNPIDGQLADDAYLVIDAVGADGRATPLQPFEDLLDP